MNSGQESQKKRDWKRPFAWAISALGFFAVILPINDSTVGSPGERILYSVLLGFGFAILFFVGGMLKSTIFRGESAVTIPFYSATQFRSFLFFGCITFGLLIKAVLIELGAVGVVVMFASGFGALGSLWITRKDYFIP